MFILPGVCFVMAYAFFTLPIWWGRAIAAVRAAHNNAVRFGVVF